MTHPRQAFAHPVARCTAFAAAVAIGALGMSAPAAASPVSTTNPDIAPADTAEQIADISTSAEARALVADTSRFDKKSRKALTQATETLVKAQDLTLANKVPADQEKRISKAVSEVSSLVAAAASSHDTAAQAAETRTERASRSTGRPEVPTAASASATAIVDAANDAAQASSARAGTEPVTAGEIKKATNSLSKLLKKPEADGVSTVSPAKKKKQNKAEKQVKDSRDSKASRGKARSAPKKSASKPKIVQDLSGVVRQYGNGQIPSKLLCNVSFTSDKLRCDAAYRAEKLNDAFHAKFGRDLTVNDAYRSYEDQVAIKASHGVLAAPPGTSNHGWGQALDLGGGISTFGSAEYNWMKSHAGKFGWHHPAWAEPNGSKPEPWHWEYAG